MSKSITTELTSQVFDKADDLDLEYEEGRTLYSDFESQLRELQITSFDEAWELFKDEYEN